MGGYVNRRAEIYGQFKQWLEQPAVQIPDSDALQADACGPTYRYDTTTTKVVLESKEDMRRRRVLSPDLADAVVLTFARPVAPSNFNRRIVYPPTGWR